MIGHYDADLALLQEVDSLAKRSNNHHQVDLLGEMLGFRYRAFFPNVRLRKGGAYGNAILSRYPIVEAENIDLTIPARKRRSVLHSRIRLRVDKSGHTRSLHVFNLHLGLSGRDRKIQLRKFLDSHPFVHFESKTPVLVAGDFNDVWGTLGPQLLAPAGFAGLKRPIQTFPSYAPVRALDSLYFRGEIELIRVFRSRLKVARQASDHLPLIADLKIC